MKIENENALLEMYNESLEEYKKSGYHPHPANLLAMLLLAEKDRFEPLMVYEGVFYDKYKKEIDEKVSKVIIDFNIGKLEILSFIEAVGILSEDDTYDENKIWFVFADGFEVMHGEMMYRPHQTPYQMYNCMRNKDKLYKMTEYGIEEQLSNNAKRRIKK